jgi:hypothetical protein
MIEPHVPEKLVFPRAWQVTSLAILLVLTLGFAIGAVSQLAA